jgi:CheY-like chemotaxis protein
VIFACEKAGTPLDCVVLDVNMPVINGMDATRRLRAIEKDRGDQTGYWVVGCTGNARAEVRTVASIDLFHGLKFPSSIKQQIELALESGMSAVITKPYKLDEMLKVIRPPKPDAEDLSTSISSSVSSQIPHKKSTL